MRTLKFLTIGLLITGITSLVSCKKDYITKKDADSKYVQQGTNNNTVQSETFTVNSYQWIDGGSSYSWYNDYYSTSNIDMSGGVFVYAYSGSQYIVLPTTVYSPEYDEGIGYAYDSDSKMVEIKYYSLSGNSTISQPGTVKFKIVSIPPSQMTTHPDVDFKDYKQVVKAFNLK